MTVTGVNRCFAAVPRQRLKSSTGRNQTPCDDCSDTRYGQTDYLAEGTAVVTVYLLHYRHQRYPGVEAGKFVDANPLGSASLRTPNGRALAGVR